MAEHAAPPARAATNPTSSIKPLQRRWQHIGVLRARHLGDLLCAIPALRALRAAQPQARITLLGLPWAREFVNRFPQYLDALLVLPCGGDLDDDAALDLRAAQAVIAEQAFDLILQLHGDGSRSNALAARLCAAPVAGFHPATQRPPSPWHLAWRRDEAEIPRWLRLMRSLGATQLDERLEWPIDDEDHAECAQLLAAREVESPYICVHAGARLASRRWPLERYAETVQALSDDGWQIVLTGSSAEREHAEALRSLLHDRRRTANLAGCTSLGALAALLARARLLIGNDTGVSHIAAAVATPSVVVSCGCDAARRAPRDRQLHQVLAVDMPCRPCAADDCPHEHRCATAIDTATLLDTVRRTLCETRRHVA